MKKRFATLFMGAMLVLGLSAAPAQAGCNCSDWYYSRSVAADGTVKMLATNYDVSSGTKQQYHTAQQSGWANGYYYQALYYFLDGVQYSGEGFITKSNRATDYGITAVWAKKTSPTGSTLNSVTRYISPF